MSLPSDLEITNNSDIAIGAIASTGVFISFEGAFGGATVALMSSTNGGTTFNNIRNFNAPNLYRYSGAVNEILKLTTSNSSAKTDILVQIR